jgi:hypothetical protein
MLFRTTVVLLTRDDHDVPSDSNLALRRYLRDEGKFHVHMNFLTLSGQRNAFRTERSDILGGL